MSVETPILLDTCAALWLGEAGALRPEGEHALQSAVRNNTPVLVSAITAWEVGVLVSRGRLSMSVDPLSWFRLLTARVDVATLSPEILIASSSLPHCDLRDPADRIIAATARLLGYRIITRDSRILAYAAAGHLRAIPC